MIEITPESVLIENNICPTGYKDCINARHCPNRNMCLHLCNAVELPYRTYPNASICVVTWDHYVINSYTRSLIDDLITAGWHPAIWIPYQRTTVRFFDENFQNTEVADCLEVHQTYNQHFYPAQRLPLKRYSDRWEVTFSMRDEIDPKKPKIFDVAQDLPYLYSLKHKCLAVWDDTSTGFLSPSACPRYPCEDTFDISKDQKTIDACAWAELVIAIEQIPF